MCRRYVPSLSTPARIEPAKDSTLLATAVASALNHMKLRTRIDDTRTRGVGLKERSRPVCRARRGSAAMSAWSRRRACSILIGAALVAVSGIAATQSGATPHHDANRPLIQERLTVQPRTLLTVRHRIAGLAVAGQRIAFYELDESCAKGRCKVDLWSRSTKRLRRHRDPCFEGDHQSLVITGNVVYWECDQFTSSIQQARIFAGLPRGTKTLRVAKSDDEMTLAGDGQQAFFSNGPFLWRLDGARRRVALRGTNADGYILDVESGRILMERSDGTHLVLLDRKGRVAHVFSSRFRCCTTAGFMLSGDQLVMENDAGIVEFYDINIETLTRRLKLKPAWFPSLKDVKHGFALYGIEQNGFHIVNIATGRDTLIPRGNDFDTEGSATLGPDGIYYAEQVRRHGRLQLLKYAQLANP